MISTLNNLDLVPRQILFDRSRRNQAEILVQYRQASRGVTCHFESLHLAFLLSRGPWSTFVTMLTRASKRSVFEGDGENHRELLASSARRMRFFRGILFPASNANDRYARSDVAVRIAFIIRSVGKFPADPAWTPTPLSMAGVFSADRMLVNNL